MAETRPAGKLIRRYEHNYFAGYVVAATRDGRRWTKYFSDKPDGKAAALARARAFRDQLSGELPWPSKFKRRYVRSTSGIIGVSRQRERTRRGAWLIRWVAKWSTKEGRQKKATFSVGRYGETEAKRRAVEARRHALADLISPALATDVATSAAKERSLHSPPARRRARAQRWARGLKGVTKVRQLVKGKWYPFYRARWSVGGRTTTRLFAITKYGAKEAQRMAAEARRQALAGALDVPPRIDGRQAKVVQRK